MGTPRRVTSSVETLWGDGGPDPAVVTVTVTVEETDTDFRAVEVTLRVSEGHDLLPSHLADAATILDVATTDALIEARSGLSWKRYIETRVPPRDHEPPGEWVARVWHTYWRESGRSQQQLANALGLTYASATTYCSRFDPSKKKPKRGASRGKTS